MKAKGMMKPKKPGASGIMIQSVRFDDSTTTQMQRILELITNPEGLNTFTATKNK